MDDTEVMQFHFLLKMFLKTSNAVSGLSISKVE
jgi:hypothetical protein